MNNNIRNLVCALSHNDYKQAKSYAKIICEIDNSSANEDFCRKTIERLSKDPLKKENMPYELSKYIMCEDVSRFREDRYYLADTEQKLFENIMNIKNTCQKLQELDIQYLNATLLYGESGTGKTTFAKYVAYKLGIPYVYLNFSQLIDSHMGATAKNLDTVIQYIRDNAGECLLMLDEVDCISANRSSGENKGSDAEINRITVTLMQEFDMLQQMPGVVVLAATNRLELLDKAFVRRFTIVHEVKALNEVELNTMAEKYLNSVGMPELTEKAKETARGKSQADAVTCIIQIIADKIAQVK